MSGVEEFSEEDKPVETVIHEDEIEYAVCCDCCTSLCRIVHFLSNIFSTILTVFDLFGLILIMSFIAHIFLLAGLRITNDPAENNKGFFVMCVTGLMLANIMAIAMWIFSRFDYYNECPFRHIQLSIAALVPCLDLSHSFTCNALDEEKETQIRRNNPDTENPNQKEEEEKMRKKRKEKKIFITSRNIIFAILLILYGLLFLLALKSFDDMTFFLMVILPMFKYILALLIYGINGWVGLFISVKDHEMKEAIYKDPILLSIYTLNGIKGLRKNTMKGLKSFVWLLIKIALSLTVFIMLMVEQTKMNLASKYKALLVFMYLLIGFPLSVNTSFLAYWCDCTDGCVKNCQEIDTKRSSKKKRFLSTYAFSFVSYAIVIALCIAVVLFYHKTNLKERKYEGIDLGSGYTYIGQPAEPTVNNKKEVISPMCYVKPYGLKMIHYAAIAYSTYYDMNLYNESDPDQNNEGKFIREYFDDPQYGFTSVKSMDLEPNQLGAANIYNFNQFNLTVIGIRGTFEKVDWNLDIQIFLSSLLLTASSIGSLTTNSIPHTAKAIRKIMAFPLEILSGKEMLDKYMNSIDLFIKENEGDFNTNVIFAGHSLGGGLSKLYGHIYGYASVSISGPGMSLLQTVYKGPKTDINMIITQSEIIPDRDIVPRVEVSSGTKFRVLCNQGTFDCHAIDHTLCMIGLMCQTPHNEYCSNLGTIKKKYDSMQKLATEYEII